jgi:hypothetical protein
MACPACPHTSGNNRTDGRRSRSDYHRSYYQQLMLNPDRANARRERCRLLMQKRRRIQRGNRSPVANVTLSTDSCTHDDEGS